MAQGSDLDFQIEARSAYVRPRCRRCQHAPSGKSDGARKTRGSKLGQSPDPADSGVRIVPLDEASDSDVKITPDAGQGDSALAGPASGKKPSDSDIRLDDSSKTLGAHPDGA